MENSLKESFLSAVEDFSPPPSPTPADFSDSDRNEREEEEPLVRLHMSELLSTACRDAGSPCDMWSCATVDN